MPKKKKINKKNHTAEFSLEKDLYNFIASKPGKGTKLKHLIKWATKFDEGGGLFDALEELIIKNRIEEIEQDVFRAKGKINTDETFIGEVDLTQSGNAYIIIDGKLNDVFVPAKKTNRAFNGDIVRVKIFPGNKKTKQEGEIVEILQRKKDTFIGTIDKTENYAFVVTDKKFNNYDFYITPEEIKRSKVNHGDRAIVRVLDWPPTMKNPIGQIIGKLGNAGEHDSDMQAILVDTGINFVFPKEVEQAAKQIDENISEKEINKRRDFRNIFTITIDPHDAKDFDDAISLLYLENGNLEIGVHIADVSFYVQPDTPIDKEGYARATSVYLVDRVIPMLPEKLSNNICSLVPHKDRFTFSAVFEFTRDGKIESEWFGKTIIHSDRRFSYEEVQEILESKEGEYVKEILDIDHIATILRKQKFKNGAIAFETQEVKFILDENKVPTGVYIKERKEAHMLIEDLMLLANKRVAELIGKQKTTVIPFVYRVHDFPDMAKLEEFGLTAKRFGYKTKLDSPKNISAELNKLMQEVKGKPEQNILESMAIRCMAKAVYTTKNIGHYGLAFPHYTHFTSPIRRYPDLMVHRILEQYLNQSGRYEHLNTLEDKCRHSSAQERKAMEAERESIKYKQVEFMSKHIGEIFDGVISGIQHYGMFVELNTTKCEGMIRVDTIRDELIFEEHKRRFVSMTNGRNFEMGDKIKIKVKNADLGMRQLDFIYVG
ncbi:MAG: ribonuclease R [Fimbriimonadaceae bacterium]|nr:ribonuclease R [Chitinophagales bacterium]